MNTQVSIGQVKRDISELVNRVAYKGERIVLTSRGRPKAALVSLEDYEKLQRTEISQLSRDEWLANAQALAEQIRRRRGDQLVDVDALLAGDRADLESRDGE
ncbi:MAG TPA: type II toxin-antitoxin system Phd/YefM family antitoxin [Anaerolineales bacterium]